MVGSHRLALLDNRLTTNGATRKPVQDRRGPATVTGAGVQHARFSTQDATGKPGRRVESRSQETSPFVPP
jgi:hypothetical protein